MENLLLALVLFFIFITIEAVLVTQSLPDSTPLPEATLDVVSEHYIHPKNTVQQPVSSPKVHVEDFWKLLDESPDSIEIFVNSLQLRPARKIAKTLKIQQTFTRNGLRQYKNLASLKQEIRQCLRTSGDSDLIDSIISNHSEVS